jgi:hypothetical protein
MIDPFVSEVTMHNFRTLYSALCLQQMDWYPHHEIVRSHFELSRRRRYVFPNEKRLEKNEHWAGAVIRMRYFGLKAGPFVLYVHAKTRIREREGF